MNAKPKKQHTVPCFLLTRFTQEQNDSSLLWVTDAKEKRQWHSSPKKAARHTDFYTGEFGPGTDAYGAEKSLSRCEARWARVIQEIGRTSRVPDESSDAFAEIMGFVAFQSLRCVSTRENIEEIVDEHSRNELIEFLSDENRWNQFICYMDSLGDSVDLTREEALAYAMRGEYQIGVDKTYKIQQQIWAAIHLMPLLSLREWSLFTPDDDAPDFVCSDSPVCVTSEEGAAHRAVGYCRPNNVITVPIGRRQALAGFFEGSADLVLPTNEVAGLNTMTMQHARQIYSTAADFTYLRDDGQIVTASDLLRIPGN